MTERLTELEGVVLSEIGLRGNATAFKVRRSFELSASATWRGSAGAVYAAVKRLVGRGLLEARPIAGKRGGNHLLLSAKGKRALRAWALDFELASDPGFDPFRMRAGLWLGLPKDQLALHLDLVERAVIGRIAQLRVLGETEDEIGRAQVDLCIRLQELRLRWINELRDTSGINPDPSSARR